MFLGAIMPHTSHALAGGDVLIFPLVSVNLFPAECAELHQAY